MYSTENRTPRTSGVLAGLAISAVIVGAVMTPTIATAAPGDTSTSSARFVTGSLLLGGVPLDSIAALQGVQTAHDGTDPSPHTSTGALDLSALSALNVSIPGGLTVPLSNFLSLGAVNQYSQSSNEGASRAASGAVNDNGIIDTTGAGTYPSNASLNLEGLLGSTVTSVVGDLDITLDAISAEAALASDGSVTRDYNVAGGNLTLKLPAITGLTNTLTGAGGVAATVDTAVGTLAGPNGLLAGALAGLNGALAPLLGNPGLNITITTEVDQALNTLLDTPVGDGVVTVNLRTGVVSADLDELLESTTGHGLNDLDVDEEVLSSAVLNNLINRVSTALQTVPELVRTTLTTTLNAARLNVSAAICLVGTAPTCTTPFIDLGTGITVSVPNQTLGNIIDGTATATIAVKAVGVNVPISVGALLNTLATPITTTLLGPSGVVATVVPTVTTAVTGIVTAIAPAVTLLNGAVSLRGNVQPSNGPIYAQEAFVLTVGDVLGAGGVGTLALAHAQVGPNARAVDCVAGLTAAVTDVTPPSRSAVLSGTGAAGETITVTTPNGPVTTIVDANGDWTTPITGLQDNDNALTVTSSDNCAPVELSVLINPLEVPIMDPAAAASTALLGLSALGFGGLLRRRRTAARN